MVVAQLVQTVVSRYIATTTPAIFAGQAITRANVPVTSTAGAAGVLGIIQADVPAFITGPQTNSIQFNQPRTAAVATGGRLAIRAPLGSSLTVGGSFGLSQGDAVPVGTASTVAATTLSGDTLVVDEIIRGADGILYILVFFS